MKARPAGDGMRTADFARGVIIALVSLLAGYWVLVPKQDAALGPLAGKIWRFGLMGYSCRPDNVMLCLSALGSVLADMGLPVHVGDAESAAHGAYAQMHVKDAQRKKKAA